MHHRLVDSLSDLPKGVPPVALGLVLAGLLCSSCRTEPPGGRSVERRIATLSASQSNRFQELVRSRSASSQDAAVLERLAREASAAVGALDGELDRRYGMKVGTSYFYREGDRSLFVVSTAEDGSHREEPFLSFATAAEADAFERVLLDKRAASSRVETYSSAARSKRQSEAEASELLRREFGIEASSRYRFDSSENALYEVFTPEAWAEREHAIEEKARAAERAKRDAERRAREEAEARAKAERKAREEAEAKASSERERARAAEQVKKDAERRAAEDARRAVAEKKKADRAAAEKEKADRRANEARTLFETARRAAEAAREADAKAASDLERAREAEALSRRNVDEAERSAVAAEKARKSAARELERASDDVSRRTSEMARATKSGDQNRVYPARSALLEANRTKAAADAALSRATTEESTARVGSERARKELESAEAARSAAERARSSAAKNLRSAERELSDAEEKLRKLSR